MTEVRRVEERHQYYLAHKEIEKARSLAYYYKNKEKALADNKRWCSQNKEKRRSSYRRKYIKNPDVVKSRVRNWCMRNKGRRASTAARYKASQMRATPPWVDREALNAVYDASEALTQATGVRHHVDHIWPLQGVGFCGLHVPWNLRAISQHDNNVKYNKRPDMGAV